MHPISEIVRAQKEGRYVGIYSCCSANEYVLKAVFQRASENKLPVLIEATANQVNQFGGYTGMKPRDFCAFVARIASEMEFPADKIILGGDHLGPLTWTGLKESEAMENAEELVRQFVLAGFTKIHIDTSMRLLGDDMNARLSDEIISRRGARLCKAAEDAYSLRLQAEPNAAAPVYVIGSEVPIPGGAQEAENGLSVTRPEDCLETYRTFKAAFEEDGLGEVWKRVVAIVVQPGVEFGDMEIFEYDPAAAAGLTGVLRELPLVFEGHSTDYQPKRCLRQMVESGIAILKVGPALTFALREALFSLENIELECFGDTGRALSNFRRVLEHAMLENNGNWEKHYHGDGNQTRFARAFSFSDRARYYLPGDSVQQAIARLLDNLDSIEIPAALISQYMPMQYSRVHAGTLKAEAQALILDRIGDCIDDYLFACGTGQD